MSERTLISWADSTINFWIGCEKVSPGCKNCYADEQDARRFSRTLGGGTKENPISHWGKGAPRYKVAGAVKDALRFNRHPLVCDCGTVAIAANDTRTAACPKCRSGYHRRRIFSLSLGDWLDEEVPIEWLAEMLDTIRQCDQVTWILCTKRPENWRGQMLRAGQYNNGFNKPLDAFIKGWWDGDKTPANIILLTSVENQAMADKRIPELLKIPAACHGLSLEPLLGAIDFRLTPCTPNISEEEAQRMTEYPSCLEQLDWLIIGGESGANARPCNVGWIRSLVEQGKAAGVATFVKQLGARPVSDYKVSRDHWLDTVADKKGGDMAEWPQGFKIQQWPKGF